MRIKKILITGGLGYIGSSLIRNLDKRQIREVIILDHLENKRFSSLFDLPKKLKFKFIKDDIMTADFDKYLSGVDIVIHLAAWVDAEGSYIKPRQSIKINFLGLKRVADACLKNKVKLFFPSTTAVYASRKSVIDETCTELAPQSPYAQAKLDSEKYLEKLGKRGLKYIVARFGTIYGHSIGINYITAVNKFIWQAIMGEPLTVWRRTAWNQKRPYLYLGDAVKALNFIIENDLFNGEIYNIVTENLTVKDIVGVIRKSVPKLKVIYVDSPNMNKLSYSISDEKFRNRGFAPSGNINKGIHESINALK